MKAYRLILCVGFACIVVVCLAASVSAAPNTGGGPGGVGKVDGSSTLELWLRPDLALRDGERVRTWLDGSGNANNASHGTWYERPLNRTNIINGLPVVDFDGNNDSLITAKTVTLPGEESIFILHDRDGNASDDCVLGNYNNSGCTLRHRTGGWEWALGSGWTDGQQALRNGGHGSTTDGIQMIVAMRSLGDGSIALYDQGGQIKQTTLTAADNTQQYELAERHNNTSEMFGGWIGEVIIHSTLLNLAERYLIENYISSKFDVALSSHDVYDGDTTANGNYDWDVCGIGRVNVDNELTSGGMSGFGLEATSGLDDGEWVTAGHAVLAGNGRTRDDVPSGMTYRWTRVWCLRKTGNLDVTLAFDYTDSGISVPNGATDYVLLYSATRDPYSFTALPISETINGDTISFAVPDASLNDGYYTIASDETLPAVTTYTGGRGPAGVEAADGTGNLEFWFSAAALSASEGDLIGTWPDLSGAGNHATQTDNQYKPIYRAGRHNGRGSLEFENITPNYEGDFFNTPNTVSTSAESVFGVLEPVLDSGITYATILGHLNGAWNLWLGSSTNVQWGIADWTDGSGALRNGPTITSSPVILSALRSVSDNFIGIYYNGSWAASTTHSNGGISTRFCVGGKNVNNNECDQSYDGYMSELIHFSRRVNTTERFLIENYLSSLYFTSPLEWYDRYAGDTAANGDYDSDVFGIGALSTTEQTAAGSAGLGLAAPWGLAPYHWVLAGHKVPSNSYVAWEGGNSGMLRWDRVWFVDVTGAVDVRLSFDHSDAGVAEQGRYPVLLYSAGEPYSWSQVEAGRSADGDRLHFDISAIDFVDGCYTLGFIPQGSLFTIK